MKKILLRMHHHLNLCEYFSSQANTPLVIHTLWWFRSPTHNPPLGGREQANVNLVGVTVLFLIPPILGNPMITWNAVEQRLHSEFSPRPKSRGKKRDCDRSPSLLKAVHVFALFVSERGYDERVWIENFFKVGFFRRDEIFRTANWKNNSIWHAHLYVKGRIYFCLARVWRHGTMGCET